MLGYSVMISDSRAQSSIRLSRAESTALTHICSCCVMRFIRCASVSWKLQSIRIKLIDFEANLLFSSLFPSLISVSCRHSGTNLGSFLAGRKRLLTAQHIPFDADDLLVLICNSNVKHELSSSEYPTRRNQCNEALKLMGLKSYREANLSHLKGELMENYTNREQNAAFIETQTETEFF